MKVSSWQVSTRGAPWRPGADGGKPASVKGFTDLHLVLLPQQKFQVIDGFGGAFSEKGWRALAALPEEAREAVLDELFLPGVGANLRVGRVPIGASDFALGWYSCNENAGDYSMEKFSIERDQQHLVPFIQAAKARCPELQLWASPWSPPTWMKNNGHYACAHSLLGRRLNDLRDDQVRAEGQDAFIQEPQHLRAYALYIRRFVDAYGDLGLPISMVMPQNEFNSSHVFPSCTWTPEGLARFIPFLGEALSESSASIFFGTLERADDRLFERCYSDSNAKHYIRGIGVQWAAREAISHIHHAHPELKVYQTEQECGDGRNDWRFARHTWALMKDFFRAGASVYSYWNIALDVPGVSTWGWPQNSMVSIDMKAQAYSLNPDYYVFKHLSHFVMPGARRIGTLSFLGYDNHLAFENPNGQIVLVIQNDLSEPMPIQIASADRGITRLELEADSFNTIVI